MATRRKNTGDAGREFFKRLSADGPYAHVFVILGEERFLVDEAVRRLVQSVFPDGRDAFNFASLHGTECKGVDIATAASQVPMFGSKRVVVAHGIEKLSSSDMEAVADYAESPFDTCLLVLEGLKLDKRQKGPKRLLAAKGAEVIEFAPLRPRDAVPWVGRRAKHHGLTVDRDVPDYLVDALGPSLTPLDMALQRIALYLGDDTHVTVDAAQAVVPDTRARSVFELTDQLAARDFAASVGCFRRLVDQGDSPIGALAMIARQFRQLAFAQAAAAQGLSEREAAAMIGCPPFRVRDYQRASRQFTEAQLGALLREIAETDLALKSSRLDRELIVERLFARICAGGVGR